MVLNNLLKRFADYVKKIPSEIQYIILLFLSTRIVLTIIGITSRILLEPFHGKEYLWIYSKFLWLDIWGVWDTGWYLDIATHGYSATAVSDLPKRVTAGQQNYAFFPLYPILMKGLGTIIGNYYVAGLIISNISLIVACIFLYKLVRLESDNKTALRSIKYLFLFPTAFILSGVFSEALFLFLIIASFYYAKKGKWMTAGIFGFFLSLTRSIGALIIIPLAWEYLKERNFEIKKIRFDILSLFLIPLGIICFAIYNHHLTGDYLAFLHVQKAWWRHTANPLTLLLNSFYQPLLEFFEGIFTLITLLILIFAYRRISFSYWLMGIYSILIPLSSGRVASLPRFILVIFPLFILFAKFSKNPYADDALTLFLALLQGFLMVTWANGFFLVI